jgi:hypothetical protein
MQSEDWKPRAERIVAQFDEAVRSLVSAEVFERGYYVAHTQAGDKVRPLPRIVVGILPVLPGVFETRHEVVLAAKHAAQDAFARSGSTEYVAEQHGNAYPQSVLFGP